MPNYRRPNYTGGTIFFTVCLADRRKSLLVDYIEKLRTAVSETRKDRPFQIDAWVVLPDHMHAIWTLPDRDRGYGVRWGAIKSKFTRSLRQSGVLSRDAMRHAKLATGTAGVWQPRFWEHHIRSAESFRRCRHYCWYNPVRHGYVDAPEDWEFSSVHRDLRNGERIEAAGYNPALLSRPGLVVS
ncbi:REP-associated tyrosine transposase [Yoonia sp. 208BN28-4]|uniref:REP-associated tyrosine transposase n=1 Tax=Yoonia sp. 208BN28-4 TaxID=3126505 RepID=UPI00403FE142